MLINERIKIKANFKLALAVIHSLLEEISLCIFIFCVSAITNSIMLLEYHYDISINVTVKEIIISLLLTKW